MDTFRGTVYADTREDAGLLDLRVPEGAREVNLGELRRAKSDDEKEALRGHTHTHLRDAARHTHTHTPHTRTHTHTQVLLRDRDVPRLHARRGGFQDALGRCTDLTYGDGARGRARVARERLQRHLPRLRGGQGADPSGGHAGRPEPHLPLAHGSRKGPRLRQRGARVGPREPRGGHLGPQAREHDWWTVGVAVGDAQRPSETPALLYDTAMSVEHPRAFRGEDGGQKDAKALVDDESYLGNSVDDYFSRMMHA